MSLFREFMTAVDFKRINENIRREGLQTEYISVFYDHVTPQEAKEIYLKQGIAGLTHYERAAFEGGASKSEVIAAYVSTRQGKIVAGYPKDLSPLYPGKAI